jgi:hypothetical protein
MPFANYEDFDACVRDNQDVDDPEAYCASIKRQVEGADALSESETKALEDSECGEGMVAIDGKCVPIEEITDVPPSALNMSSIYQLSSLDTEPITREELDGDRIAYRNMAILQSGMWTDSASREQIWYSPRGLENLEVSEDNVVNIMHDADNEVSAAGRIIPDSLQASDGTLYADVELDTSSAAGQYADENLQKTLKTEGAKGFGGPSVEIDADGQEVEYNNEKGMRELLGGILSGLGFVKNPASKPVSFARQTAERGVALSGGSQSVMRPKKELAGMPNAETVREILESNGVDTGEMSDDEVMAIGEDLLGEYEDMEEGTEAGDYEDDDEEEEKEAQEDGEEEEMPEDEPPEEEDDEMEMETKIQSLEERLQNLEDMMETAMAAEDVQEELEEFSQDLADADTVKELEEAKEDLEARLSSLEDEPKDPRSLADTTDGDGDVPENVQSVGEYDRIRGTYSR